MHYNTYLLLTSTSAVFGAPVFLEKDESCVEHPMMCNFNERQACMGPLEEKDTTPGTNTQTICLPYEDNCQGDFVEYTATGGDSNVKGKTFVKGEGAVCTYSGRDNAKCESDMDCDLFSAFICVDMAY